MILDLHPCRALVLISFRMATAAARASVMALWRRGIVWFAVIRSDIRRAMANWLFVFVALQLLIADGAGVTSTLVSVDEREEVSSGLEVPGPEGVREFTRVGGK